MCRKHAIRFAQELFWMNINAISKGMFGRAEFKGLPESTNDECGCEFHDEVNCHAQATIEFIQHSLDS